MANAKLSVLATQMAANSAAVATALAGTVVTSDVTALAALLATMSLRSDMAIPLIGQSTTQANAATMIQQG